MEGRHFCYPGPRWFSRAFGGSYIETWIKDREQPHWYRPATLHIVAPWDARLGDWGSGGEAAEDFTRAEQLRREMAIFMHLSGAPARVSEMYWSAAVAALNERALKRVHAAVNACFRVEPGARFTARLGARFRHPAQIAALREFGVTTLHAACAPIHSYCCESIEQWVASARKGGFACVALDMPIDVPSVSIETVREWVAALSASRPDRIFLTRAPAQSGIRKGNRAPDHESRTEQAWRETYATLIASGYEYVAHDVFVLHTDEFAKAKRAAALTPTPFGYSICPSHVSIGIGQGAIGHVGPMQYQNARDPRLYAALLGRAVLPVERGHLSAHDDLVRRAVIAGLFTDFCVDMASIEAAYDIDFGLTFGPELVALDRLAQQGAPSAGRIATALDPDGALRLRSCGGPLRPLCPARRTRAGGPRRRLDRAQTVGDRLHNATWIADIPRALGTRECFPTAADRFGTTRRAF